MQKTQIVYRGKKPDISEVQELMPHLDITLTPYVESPIPTTFDQIYNIRTIDWTWFRKQFDILNDVSCFVFQKPDLKKLGITDHWGFYSLDEDTDHQFYMTDLGPKLIDKAIKNGFRTNFARMFCHEYLHGAVWGETRDRDKAGRLVHEWEAQGILKQKIKEDLDRYNTRLNTKNVLESIVARLVTYLTPKAKTGLLPCVDRASQAIISEMKMLGHEVRIVEGYRSIERQNELYAQGRTTPGKIVTNAKGGESFHNYRCAVDFVFKKEGYNASKELWETLGTVGEKHDFEWGGSPAWIKAGLNDRPHFQMTKGYSISDFIKGKVDYSKFS